MKTFTIQQQMPICQLCNGSGIVNYITSIFSKEAYSRCDNCGGYGFNKYLIQPMRSFTSGKVIAWVVVVPNRDFIKIEFSFDNALVWVDVHAANYYGKQEVA